MRILLIEDDPATAQSIEMMLRNANLNVYTTDLGEEGVDLAKLYDYDLILLDLNLPDMTGYDVLKRLRVAKVDTPILILSGMSGTDEKVRGFGSGADDYLTKPFQMDELLARLRALMRRSTGQPDPVFKHGSFEFDTRSGRVTVDGMYVQLTAQETNVLGYLIAHKDRVVSRTELSEHVYGYDTERDSNTIEVFIGRLRKKLGQKIIVTIRGRGYQFDGT